MPKLRKPVALLKAKGTYQDFPSRPSQQNRLEENLPMLPSGTIINTPDSLHDDEIIQLWNIYTSQFIGWHILNEVDLKTLELAFIYLEELKEATKILQETKITDDIYNTILRNHLKLSTAFNKIMSHFGVTPTERSRLTLQVSQTKVNETLLDKIQKGSK